jgi:hypothetical protein
MSRLHRVALVAAIVLSGVALYDAAHVGITGRPSGFSDEFGVTLMTIIGELVHGVTYATLLVALVATGPSIDAGSPVRRWIRRLLVLDLGLLAAMFLIGSPFLPALERAGWGGVASAIGSTTFLLMFILAVALGVASVRRPAVRPAALVLISTVPLIGLAVGLGALGSGFAHPAYAEAAVNLGIVLLSYQAARVRTPTTTTTALTPAAVS